MTEKLAAELRSTADWIDERATVLDILRATGVRQAAEQVLREEAARYRGRAFLLRQVVERALSETRNTFVHDHGLDDGDDE